MKKQDEQKIDEKTLLPISLIILLFGAAMWIGVLQSKVSAHDEDLSDLKSTAPGSLRDDIKKQGESLARIEGILSNKK